MDTSIKQLALNSTEPSADEDHRERIQTPSHRQDDDTEEPRLFPFMCLPKELRLEVYSYLSTFTYKPIDCICADRFGYWPVNIYHPSLLVSRTIHNEAMDHVNDRQPATILCKPNQQQKYCAIQTGLQLGYDLDRAWREKNRGCGVGAPRISPEVVEAVVRKIVERVPYSQRRAITKLPIRLCHLRHFIAQTIIRLRQDPQVHLDLIVKTRPYRRFYNWYGSETAARAVSYYTRDAGDLWLLRANLLNAYAAGATNVRTKLTVKGKEGDKALERIKRGLSLSPFMYRRSEDVVCVSLSENGFEAFPSNLRYRV